MAKKTASPKVTSKGNKFVPLLSAVLVLSLTLFAYVRFATKPVNAPGKSNQAVSNKIVQTVDPIKLPKPALTGKMSLEASLQNRRSRRTFTPEKLKLSQISQLLWAAQGVTTDWGGRTTPSAKSAYPLTVLVAAYNVDGLNPGLYQYLPGDKEMVHALQLVLPGDLKANLAAAVGQNAASDPAALFFITGDFEKMAKSFDNKRVDENVYLEVGHAAQNLYLQTEALGLGMVTIAGFDEAKVASVLQLPASQQVIYAIPVGYPKQ